MYGENPYKEIFDNFFLKKFLEQIRIIFGAVVVAHSTARLLPIPVDHSLSPVIGNFYWTVIYLLFVNCLSTWRKLRKRGRKSFFWPDLSGWVFRYFCVRNCPTLRSSRWSCGSRLVKTATKGRSSSEIKHVSVLYGGFKTHKDTKLL